MPDAAPSSRTSNFLLVARSTDKRGRPVTTVNGQEVSNNLNYNVCFVRIANYYMSAYNVLVKHMD